jgi:AcrR family transcriptional regulator
MPETTPRPRPYDSPIRRLRVEQMRERIVVAGAEIVHSFPIWNWDAVTHRAVAERSTVSLRTVYRYFPTERELRDAVLERLAVEASVNFEALRMEDLSDTVNRLIGSLAEFPRAPRSKMEPTIETVRRKQRDAYAAAVARVAKEWTERDQQLAAAMVYVVSTNSAYTTLVDEWGFDPKEAALGITWVIDLIRDALRDGDPLRT